MSRRLRAAAAPLALLALFALIALASCTGPSKLPPFNPTPAPPSPSASGAPSPVISIYPVPPQSSPPTPQASPSHVLPDVTGIPCGQVSHTLDHHVRVLTRYSCYRVAGSTPQELQAWVATQGPRAEGRVAAAVTHWKLRWSYSVVPGDSTCEVARPDVQVVLVYVLPAWMPPAGTSEATIQYWRDYSAAVQAHEAHHGSIAEDGGRAARKSLLGLPPATTCDRASATADARVKAIIARYRGKQHAFDAAAGG